jgi:hypothetical protein
VPIGGIRNTIERGRIEIAWSMSESRERNWNWRRHPLVRLLSSLRFGVTLIALVVAYASVMSALPQVRGALEMTEMQAFRHWLFFGLIILLCVSVTVATFARIRFNLLNAGVLTIHSGLLLLCLGSIWYFGTKVEGDILLRSPRIDLLSLSETAPPRVIASILPEAGRVWSNVMPAFGGRVALEVVETEPAERMNPDRAIVRVQFGEAQPRTMTLAADDEAPQPIAQRLALQFVRFAPARTFYDQERPAIYVRRAGAADWSSAEIPGLPLYRERYRDEGYVLSDTDGQSVPTKRYQPSIGFGPLNVPTGWFERWRLPIAVPVEAGPFDMQITGFVPYIAEMRDALIPGGETPDPALSLKLEIPGTRSSLERALFANDPGGSLLELQTPVEFRWAASPAQIEEWLTPLVGPDELFIKITDPPVAQRVAIRIGEPTKIEGTPYELTVQQVFPAWPLMSPGFEAARSPAALVEVRKGDSHFTRTVIQRFPQLSQDIDDQGVRRRDGLVDANISLGYRTAGWILIAAEPRSVSTRECAVGVFDPNGQVQRHVLRIGQPQRLSVSSTPLDLTVTQLLERGQRAEMPVIEPLERRRASLAARAASAIRLKFTGRERFAGWNESRWVTFSQYPDIDARPLLIRPPGSPESWEIVYSRLAHDLGAALTPGRLSVKFFPGRQSVDTWRSDFLARNDDWDRPLAASVYTNQTWSIGPWTLFQSGAAQDNWSYTILGVGNRRGIWPMVLGCIMITIGCLYAFYVKPVLRRRIVTRALTNRPARSEPEGRPNKAFERESVESVL